MSRTGVMLAALSFLELDALWGLKHEIFSHLPRLYTFIVV